MQEVIESRGRTLLDMNAYQWTVILAAWLGWGFDVFDGLLFNYVAPNCVPTLLGLPLGSTEAKAATLQWTGILTSVLLIGWAIGGVIFGKVADRIGRTKTLLLTMLLYSIGTAACAIAPNIWVLMACRIVSSLGIGGEWAAGAAMVAEVVPEKRRVEAGALLYTSAPMGLFLATFVTFQVTGVYFTDPAVSWRYVFLFGLLPAAVAFVVRLFIKEPERWKSVAAEGHAKIAELFTPQNIRITISGFVMAVTALIMWWSCNAFIPVVAKGLAMREGQVAGFDPAAIEAMGAQWIKTATNSFNLGGLIGTLLTIPAAKFLGRKKMFFIYFLGSAVALMAAFG
jgi:MFS family permease